MVKELKVASIFLLGATIGGAGSYWVAYSTLKKSYDRAVQAEVQEVREHYKVIHKDRSYETPEDYAAEKLEKDAVEEEHNMRVSAYSIETERAKSPTTAKARVEHRSIFDYSNPMKNPEKEDIIDNGAISVISFEEFDGEDIYTKTTLTYYMGDDTVVDEVDEVIEDVKATIGPEVLGLLSQQDSVYIRNDILRTDYEVVVDDGRYDVVVKGGTG